MSNDITKKIFSKNLDTLIKKQGKTVMDLSEELGISYSTVSDWKNGKKMPRGGSLQKLSDYFGVNLSVLLEEDTDSLYRTQRGISHDEVELPLYGDVAAGALAELESVDVWDVETVKLPKLLLQKYASDDNLFAMKVNGDSMNNVIPDGSLIVVKPIEQSLYKDGDIVVFSYNGEYSLKKYRPNIMENFVLFESDSNNPDFKNIPINEEELAKEANMYGKVVLYVVSL